MKKEQNDLVSIKRLTDQIGQFRQALLSIPDDFSHDILASFKPVKHFKTDALASKVELQNTTDTIVKLVC